MPLWTRSYFSQLEQRFEGIVDGLQARMEAVRDGTAEPALSDLAIGSARHVRGAVLFFDICGYTRQTARDDIDALLETLYMLDCVIPMVMHVIFDYGGYVEKNTGDGVMAIVGVGEDAEDACTTAIDIAVVSLYTIEHIVNPHLAERRIDSVEVSFGIDYGELLLARIGTRRGAARHERSHITAVGPTANIAFQLQEHARSNEVAVGGLVRAYADKRADFFVESVPSEWSWVLGPSERAYGAWKYTGRRKDPA